MHDESLTKELNSIAPFNGVSALWQNFSRTKIRRHRKSGLPVLAVHNDEGKVYGAALLIFPDIAKPEDGYPLSDFEPQKTASFKPDKITVISDIIPNMRPVNRSLVRNVFHKVSDFSIRANRPDIFIKADNAKAFDLCREFGFLVLDVKTRGQKQNPSYLFYGDAYDVMRATAKAEMGLRSPRGTHTL